MRTGASDGLGAIKMAVGVLTMKKITFAFLTLTVIVAGLSSASVGAQTARWPEQKANAWYARQPWLVGSNYVPKSAINQLERWQETTFDPEEIEKELNWAAAMGMNTMRVFLHDLLGQQDAVGFRSASNSSWRLRRVITSVQCLCCSIPAGTRCLISVRSIPPFPASTTQVGCRVPARPPSGTPVSTLV